MLHTKLSVSITIIWLKAIARGEIKMKDIKIIVAAHKNYRMPKDNMYVPVHVGAEGKTDKDGNVLDLGYTKDNTGDHISEKNPYYCELTGIYWAWKNLEADYLGLAHYRRHFTTESKVDSKDPFDKVIGRGELGKLCQKYKVIVPKKRRYYIESLYSHYAHTHYAEHLDKVREIMEAKYSEYVADYDKVVKRTYGYMFNMMVMERPLYDEYCQWLFDILGELENKVDTEGLSVFQSRFYGRVSEIIFNVWLEHQLREGRIKKSQIKELPFIYMEKINRFKKGISFIKAKLFHKRYSGSF